MPCLQACPQQAFAKTIYNRLDYGLDTLPGRSGTYDRFSCNRQMASDESDGGAVTIEGRETAGRLVKYCRACELACPMGKR